MEMVIFWTTVSFLILIAFCGIFLSGKSDIYNSDFATFEKWDAIHDRSSGSAISHSSLTPFNDTVPYQKNSKSCFSPHPYFRKQYPEKLFVTPVVNVGFPKAGTTSLWKYFQCGLDERNSIHQNTFNDSALVYHSTEAGRSIKLDSVTHDRCDTGERNWKTKSKDQRSYCGFCIRDAIGRGLPPLSTCGNFDVYSQLDITKFDDCSFPQMDYLEQIHRENPNITLVMTMRNPEHWYGSLVRFRRFNLKLGRCKMALFPNGPGHSYEELKKFFCVHVEFVRDFVLKHPSHALIEIDAEDPDTGSYLERVFGIRSSCWGQANKNPTNGMKDEVKEGIQ